MPGSTSSTPPTCTQAAKPSRSPARPSPAAATKSCSRPRATSQSSAGTADFPAEQIVEAQRAADRHGHIPFRTDQPPYSVLVRGIEATVLPTAQKYGLGVLTWSPLNSGWLTGQFRRGEPIGLTGFRRAVARKFDLGLPGNQRKLAAADNTLDDETLDRIDEIVPPGVNLNPLDTDYSPPALANAGQRRRASRHR